MVAALLGAGPVADAFLAAFQLVNVVRRLLTEGGAERGAGAGLAARAGDAAARSQRPRLPAACSARSARR